MVSGGGTARAVESRTATEECNESEAKNERPVDNRLLQKDKERERKMELVLHRFFPECERHGVGEEEEGRRG